MDSKVLDLNKTVYQLCSADPEVKVILAEAGFVDILKPGMLETAGRFMTIPKGAKAKGIDLEVVKKLFAEHGYSIKEGNS
ncbi:MAG TPA: DUF1858 domain-containing protein [Bacillota bacterium]|nr:DUF1858 domain-containing protein [Clostridiales bacterium]HPT85192.1 DUF1858 domain-containing protein [Bacillota bacterium]